MLIISNIPCVVRVLCVNVAEKKEACKSKKRWNLSELAKSLQYVLLVLTEYSRRPGIAQAM